MSSVVDNGKIIFRKTARSALFHILSSARRKIGTTKVLVPSFCCPSVYLSVLFSKCEPILVDVDLKNYSLLLVDLTQKLDAKTLAVIYPHMFGINGIKSHQDLDILRQKFPDTIWIEDACQTFANETSSGKNLGSSLDFGLYSCDPVKPIKGSMGYIIQFNESKILGEILESAKAYEKFAITDSRLAELKRFEASFFTSIVSYCRLSGKSAPKFKEIDILADLYLDNERPNEEIFSTSKKEIEFSKKVNRERNNRFYRVFSDKLKLLNIPQLSPYSITADDIIWRYPVVVNDANLAFELSNVLRLEKINCSNHYYSISKIFSVSKFNCKNSIYLSDRILNFWFVSKEEVEIAIDLIKRFFDDECGN
tara:strand:+ start:3935 stop:5032 length:1098 start_codon:yes stop_codon:yes gene_type:complete